MSIALSVDELDEVAEAAATKGIRIVVARGTWRMVRYLNNELLLTYWPASGVWRDRHGREGRTSDPWQALRRAVVADEERAEVAAA